MGPTDMRCRQFSLKHYIQQAIRSTIQLGKQVYLLIYCTIVRKDITSSMIFNSNIAVFDNEVIRRVLCLNLKTFRHSANLKVNLKGKFSFDTTYILVFQIFTNNLLVPNIDPLALQLCRVMISTVFIIYLTFINNYSDKISKLIETKVQCTT